MMETLIQKSILKINADLLSLKYIEKLPMSNHVKPAKQKDVKNLMMFFNVPDEVMEFYNNIFKHYELPEKCNETNEE